MNEYWNVSWPVTENKLRLYLVYKNIGRSAE